MYKVIANWKIDRLVNLLVASPYRAKIDKIERLCEEYIEGVILRCQPQEVITFMKEHPSLIKNIGQIHLEGNVVMKDGNVESKEAIVNISRFINLNVPHVEVFSIKEGRFVKMEHTEMYDTFIKRNWKDISKYLIDTIRIDQERKTLENQVKCTLAKLKTYDKVKQEFPEAYELLITKIDGKEIKEEEITLCDNIEELRAKLKSDKENGK